MKKYFLLLFCGILCLTYFLVFAARAEAIGNPVKISNSANAAIGPEIATDSNGYLHVAYMEVASENTIWGGHANSGIHYSRWNGDTWSTPLKISENTGFAEVPAIAADSTNVIHTVWDDETYGSGVSKVAYKTRSAAGVWSLITSLPSPTGTSYNWNARIAIGASNTPNVVFTALDETTFTASEYWTQFTAGSWTTPVLISKDESDNTLDTCQIADLKNDSSGNIHLIYWCSEDGPFAGGIFYRKYTAGSWSTPLALKLAHDIFFAKMAVSPAGQVFVSWYQLFDSSVRTRWTISGVWQSETTLTTIGDKSIWGYPIMGVTTDSKERAHIGWGEKDAGNLIDIKYKSYVSGSWGAAQDVDLDNSDADSPFIYPDKWDNQHFAWTEKNPATSQWEIYYRVAEGTIQSVTTAGATVNANPNNISYVDLSIPSGALSSATQIGIQIGPVPESVSQSQVTIPRAFTFRPNGLVFNSASTATVYYNEAELAGADERLLMPWFWNSQTNGWEAKNGTVNRPQNRIAVTLNGFSLYGISAPLFDEAEFSNFAAGQTIKQRALPLNFKLKYKDGSNVLPPEISTDLLVIVKDLTGNTLLTRYFEPNGVSMTGNGNYRTVLNLPKSNFGSGQYFLEIYITDVLVAHKSFILE